MPLSFEKLPVEIIYKILDHLHDKTVLFLNMANISVRLNQILNSYQRFRVSTGKYISVVIYHNVVFFFVHHVLSLFCVRQIILNLIRLFT